MPKAPKTLNVSLTPELSQFIAVRVASGRYQSASEVVRAGLRLLERDEADWAARNGMQQTSERESRTGAGEQRG
ncbi:type II toxin-antitoxin system ParD family antitoxin [Methylorubrum rhodesianum]|uniref:Type II toxin-antitoxin system ParD family antitoxin n=1 Tax=Methylorubrum rhodesianum TaxID=29427 RepID=A0ABU9ZAP5_9HYPH